MDTMTRLETYTQQKNRHSKEVGEFKGIFWAFSNEQFKEGLAKVGVLESEVKDKLWSIGSGGYMLKTQSAGFDAMFKRQALERKELKKDIKKLYDALVYELRNHEYCITYNPQDALDALGLTKEDVDPILLKKACKESLEGSN